MPAQPNKLLTDIFGSKEIGDLVKEFDFSRISTRDPTKDDFLHLGLAPSYGNLSSEAIKRMTDDFLKIMIAGTMKDLGKVPARELNWDRTRNTMMQNPLLEPDNSFTSEIRRADKVIKNSTNDFKFDGSPDAAIVQEVKSSLTNLIKDEKVIASTKIDLYVLARIVAQAGAIIDSFETFFVPREYHEKNIVDIGVLQFPDEQNPYFKLYRIQLKAWYDSSRILFHDENKNGITLEYNAQNFKPRREVLEGLRQETRKLAIKMAEDLFA